ncbi:MAG: M23 family metallopeptidase [Patescibacteria group bacterium]
MDYIMKSRNTLVLTLALVAGIYATNLLVGCSEEKSSNPIESVAAAMDNTQTSTDSITGTRDQRQGMATASYNAYPGGWKFPFCGSYYISAGYGPNGGSSYHTGSDYNAVDWSLPGWQDYGHAIPAPANGTVIQVVRGWTGYGHFILVDAGNGYRYRIAHMLSIAVSVGQWVSQGQYLGQVGNTGTTTPHIHFVVYRKGSSVIQNGISGKDPLLINSYYSSNQLCMSTQ